MKTHSRLITIALAVAAQFTMAGNNLALAQAGVPANLQPPQGNIPYLAASATGTQNYMCVPAEGGPTWKFVAPQATLFLTVPLEGGTFQQQVITHFLSPNVDERGLPRPTWQSSMDSSVVWGKAVQSSTDPAFVAAGAIPWLLVQSVGAQRGPSDGGAVAHTTFIQRIHTEGGLAPAEACTGAKFGTLALVPYRATYVFFKAQ